MNNKYTDEVKQALIVRYSFGNESVAEIVADTGIPRSTIYNWIKQNQKVESSKSTEFTVKDYRRLENRVKRLELIIEIIKKAYEKRKPSQNLMFHSDRGGNYIATAFREYLESLHITQSFSRSGVPYDNSVMETFFSSMKREELYRTKYRSKNEFKAAVDKYILFYNEQRPHAKNAYKTPAKKEADFFNTQADLQ